MKCEVYHSNELEELEVSSKDNLIAENWVWKAIFPSGSHNGVTGGYARRRIIDFERDITINDIEFIILGPSRGGISKFNISISNNAVNWVNIGYVKSAGTFGWEKILVKGDDIIQDTSFRYLRVDSVGSQYIDGVRVYGESKINSRNLGVEYEQLVDVDSSIKAPQIIEINKILIDATTNIYELSISNFKCDTNGKCFFFWRADGATFISTNQDYTKVKCIIDKGVSGRKVPIKVGIGDSLGHVSKYTIWL